MSESQAVWATILVVSVCLGLIALLLIKAWWESFHDLD